MKTGKYRSKLEQRVATILGKGWAYENTSVNYVLNKSYIPDFTRGKKHIEVKGFFRPGDITKYKAIGEAIAGTDLELIFIFADPHKPVRKGAKLTMAKWAEKNRFRWFGVNDMKRKDI